jgi:ArsR family transcriptional regulator, arsenate/arsenite/antimonite-responsive transcriptional repressor
MLALTSSPNSVFQALADPIRVRIIRLLVSSKEELCLCDLSASLAEPDYKLSRHVKILREAGLVAAQREGRWVYHSTLKSNRHVENLYRFVAEMPEGSNSFSKDLTRFRQLLKARKSARCTSNSVIRSKRSPS